MACDAVGYTYCVAYIPPLARADWTPNTNHTGFYVAKALGLFEKEGLDVKLLGTNDPLYQGSYSAAPGDEGAEKETYKTPCSMVADGLATFAINSPEGKRFIRHRFLDPYAWHPHV